MARSLYCIIYAYLKCLRVGLHVKLLVAAHVMTLDSLSVSQHSQLASDLDPQVGVRVRDLFRCLTRAAVHD